MAPEIRMLEADSRIENRDYRVSSAGGQIPACRQIYCGLFISLEVPLIHIQRIGGQGLGITALVDFDEFDLGIRAQVIHPGCQLRARQRPVQLDHAQISAQTPCPALRQADALRECADPICGAIAACQRLDALAVVLR